jgi:hypothetical protein
VAIPQTFFLDAEHRIVDRVYGAVTSAELAKGVALMDMSKAPAKATPHGSGRNASAAP